MKMKAAIVIAALLLSMAAPFSLHISASDSVPVLVTFNVCNAADGMLSVNADIPVIQECSFTLAYSALFEYINLSNPDYFSSIIAFKQERPPEA